MVVKKVVQAVVRMAVATTVAKTLRRWLDVKTVVGGQWWADKAQVISHEAVAAGREG